MTDPQVLSEIPISAIRVRAAATGTAKPISRKRFEKWLAEHDQEIGRRMGETTRFHKVTLRGCDDLTQVQLDLTDQEVAVLARVAAASEKESDCTCMPTLHVDAICEEHDELMYPTCWKCDQEAKKA